MIYTVFVCLALHVVKLGVEDEEQDCGQGHVDCETGWSESQEPLRGKLTLYALKVNLKSEELGYHETCKGEDNCREGNWCGEEKEGGARESHCCWHEAVEHLVSDLP